MRSNTSTKHRSPASTKAPSKKSKVTDKPRSLSDLCGGCKLIRDSGYIHDESDVVHDKTCLFYKPEPPTFRLLRDQLLQLITQWEIHASKYFVLAKREQDPLGKKFYESSAMAYANCATSADSMLASIEKDYNG